MALLQIAEPGQSPQPHQRRLAVGIDLGTTNSLVAAVRSGRTAPLPDAQGRVILPSAVRYLAGGLEVGHAAVAANHNQTIQSQCAGVGQGLFRVGLAGQGIGAIHEVTSTADLVARLRREYEAARARLLGR